MGISREQFFRSLGVCRNVPGLDELTHRAYRDLAEETWRENLDAAPHGKPWHTSFHASAFDNPCQRFQIYTLLDIPDPEPFAPFSVAVMQAGRDVEYQIVYRWVWAGLTVGMELPEKYGDPIKQVGFEDPETWLTGSVDTLLGLKSWGSVLPTDVKSKEKSVIDEMKVGSRSYDPKHWAQVQAYIYLERKFHDLLKTDLRPAEGGLLYYASRDNPRHAIEFYFDADWDFIDEAIARLKETKEAFLSGRIPERPKEYMWSKEQCQYCRFKKFACKPDDKVDIADIADTHGTTFAQELRKSYDQQKTIQEVLKRWKPKSTNSRGARSSSRARS